MLLLCSTLESMMSKCNDTNTARTMTCERNQDVYMISVETDCESVAPVLTSSVSRIAQVPLNSLHCAFNTHFFPAPGESCSNLAATLNSAIDEYIITGRCNPKNPTNASAAPKTTKAEASNTEASTTISVSSTPMLVGVGCTVLYDSIPAIAVPITQCQDDAADLTRALRSCGAWPGSAQEVAVACEPVSGTSLAIFSASPCTEVASVLSGPGQFALDEGAGGIGNFSLDCEVERYLVAADEYCGGATIIEIILDRFRSRNLSKCWTQMPSTVTTTTTTTTITTTTTTRTTTTTFCVPEYERSNDPVLEVSFDVDEHVLGFFGTAFQLATFSNELVAYIQGMMLADEGRIPSSDVRVDILSSRIDAKVQLLSWSEVDNLTELVARCLLCPEFELGIKHRICAHFRECTSNCASRTGSSGSTAKTARFTTRSESTSSPLPDGTIVNSVDVVADTTATAVGAKSAKGDTFTTAQIMILIVTAVLCFTAIAIALLLLIADRRAKDKTFGVGDEGTIGISSVESARYSNVAADIDPAILGPGPSSWSSDAADEFEVKSARLLTPDSQLAAERSVEYSSSPDVAMIRLKAEQVFILFDFDQSGELSADELQHMMFQMKQSSGMPIGNADEVDAQMELIADMLVTELDIEGLGEITKEKFLDACVSNEILQPLLTSTNLSNITVGAHSSKCLEIFEIFDRDESGALDLGEIVTMVTSIAAAERGSLVSAEIERMDHNELAEIMRNEFDENRDGTVTLGEFTKTCTESKGLMAELIMHTNFIGFVAGKPVKKANRSIQKTPALDARLAAKLRSLGSGARQELAGQELVEEQIRKEEERQARLATASQIAAEQDKLAEGRAEQAKTLTISDTAVEKLSMAGSSSAQLFGTTAGNAREKSKIWQALNPQSIAHQTAADRRKIAEEAEEAEMASGAADDLDGFNGKDAATYADTDEDGADEPFDEADLQLDSATEAMLKKAQEKRAKEEVDRQKSLSETHSAESARADAEREAEMKVIAAEKKLKRRQSQRELAIVKKNSSRRLEEIDFDFGFFLGADTDGDGMLSLKEAKAAGMSESQFREMDVDGNGQLTQEEFDAWRDQWSQSKDDDTKFGFDEADFSDYDGP